MAPSVAASITYQPVNVFVVSKVMSPSLAHTWVSGALGVAGVNVPAPKVYETISSGVADGVFFPMETMYAFKVAELTKHTYRNTDGIYTTSFAIILNSDTFNGLSSAHRKCVEDMRGVKMAAKVGAYWDAADDLGMEKGLEAGLVITDARFNS